jgi:hypothetical protein
VFCIYLRTNSDLCHLQHKLIGFYNRDEKCLQRGTDWILVYNSSYITLSRPVVTICTAQWSLYVPLGLAFKKSTFCSHSVFMCFVWIWEQTAIISLYSINWLVFVTEAQGVYCAVRAEFLTTTLKLHKAVTLKPRASTNSLTNQDRTTATISCFMFQ